MTKKVIAIISVLKPVDDTRNYEKVARSIGNTNKYEINIIGFSAKKIPADPNISFHPVFNFRRTSLKRILAPYAVFSKLLKLKPELIIVTCAELLIVTVLYKIIFGSKIIYDIQENYVRNFIYSPSYSLAVKMPLAGLTRGVELISSFYIDQFILAEHIYYEQLKFTRNRAIVFDNKAVINSISNKPPYVQGEKLQLVYSGTISQHYGIFDAIGLVDKLKAAGWDAQLKIVGYSADRKVYNQLVEITRNKDYIDITGGDSLVSHDQILIEISKAHFCLLPYQANKSTEGRIPTKLYECLAMEKPVIITSNQAWDELIEINNAGIIHDFQSEVNELLAQLTGTYYGNGLAAKYDWKTNEPMLLATVDQLLN